MESEVKLCENRMEWMELTQEKECVLISMCGIFVVDAGFRIKQSDGV